MFRSTLLFLLGLLSAPMASQDPANDPRPRPDRVDLGNLARGGRAEFSFAVEWNDKALVGRKAEFTLPPFVRVCSHRTEAAEDIHAETIIEAEIATDKLGSFKSVLEIRCGGRKCTMPIEAVVLPEDPVATRVLVVSSPFRHDSTDDSRQFDAWRRVVRAGKLQVQYVYAARGAAVLRVPDLAQSDVLFLSDEALVRLMPEDVKLAQGFACGGGRVVVSASRFFAGTVAKANAVIEPFGLSMKNIEPPGLEAIELEGGDLTDHEWVRGLDKVSIRRPTPTVVTNSDVGLPLVRITYDYAFVAMARTPNGGEVVTLGAPLATGS